MSQKIVPTDRSIAWISLVPQLILMGIIFGVFYILKVKEPFLFVGFTYLLLSFGLKKIFLRNHNKGITLTKEGKNVEAIASFEKSAKFFSDHRWLDHYRFLTLLSASKCHYREMALVNISYCYMDLDNQDKAKEYYMKVLQEYPDNEMAKLGLGITNSK